jgi:uncharacterized protein (TIGR02001 family)
MKTVFQGVLGAAGLMAMTCLPAAAQTVSVNGALTTNYVFRGFTQTVDNPAIQGGADVDFGNGLAVGTWASSIDFQDPGSDNSTSPLEVDLYASYTRALNDMFGIVVGGIGYLYPNASSVTGGEYDFFEAYAGVNITLMPATITGKVYWSPDVFGFSEDSSLYYTAGVSVPFGMFAVFANIGYYDYENLTDVTDWNIGASVTWNHFTLTGTYTDTDYDSPYSDEKFIAAISFKFP